MSNYLFDNARQIQEWNIEAPFGNFIIDEQTAAKTENVFLAGGSGISPLYSMLKSIGKSSSKPLLLYSNRFPHDAIFYDELEELQSENKLDVYYSFSGEHYKSTQLNHLSGRFSPLVIRSIIRKQVKNIGAAHYFICGPTSLMKLYRDVLEGMNIPKQQIHMEYFDPPVIGSKTFQAQGQLREVLVNYYKSVFRNDEPETQKCTSLIEVGGSQTLLDAMKENDIEVPHSCLAGTCGSCWAIKESGSVEMTNNYALPADDVAEGKILLCQSFPIDEKVSILLP